jgi:hypothetical protein
MMVSDNIEVKMTPPEQKINGFYVCKANISMMVSDNLK